MKQFLIAVIVILVIVWVWNEKSINPEYINQADTVFIVKSKTLNIRKAGSSNSKIIGKLNRNDSIRGIVTDKWLNINGTDSCGYVATDNLNMQIMKSRKSIYAGNDLQMQIKSFITSYISLKKWYIWVAIILLLIISVSANVLLHKLETKIFKWRYKYNHERINWFPYLAGFLFVLLGIVSVFFQHKSIIAVSSFSLFPFDKGWVAWYWAIIIWIIGIAFIYSTINGFFHYGFGLGLLRFAGELITALLTILTLYLFSIVLSILAILGILLYIIFVGFNSSSNFKMPDTSDMIDSWRRYEKRQNDFWEKQSQAERWANER